MPLITEMYRTVDGRQIEISKEAFAKHILSLLERVEALEKRLKEMGDL